MTLRRSIFASLFGTYGVFVLQVATSMVLSRLLTPAEVGVWGAAQAAIFLSSALRDFGAGDYLIRSGEINARTLGQVFAVMLSISLICAIALWFARGEIAVFFHEPRLSGLIAIATLTFLLMPFGLGSLVMMERDLAFVVLHLMSFAAAVVGSLTAIILAWRGYSFYSLAWGQFANMATVTILRTIARPKGVFCLPVFSGWQKIFHFGIFTTFTTIIWQVTTQAMTAIIGRVLGFGPLGLYDRSQSMSNYVNPGLIFPLMQVVYVGFARVKDKPRELGLLFVATIENLTGVLWPAYALMALVAPQMFYVLYGSQWMAAAPLFRLICLAGLLVTVYGVQLRVLTAVGRVQTIFMIEALMMCVRIPVVLVLVHYGIWYAVLGFAAPVVISMPLYWRALRPYLLIPRHELVSAFGHSLVVTLFTIAPVAVAMTSRTFAETPMAAQLATSLLLASGGWLASVWLCGHRVRGEIIGIFQHGVWYLSRAISKSSPPAPVPTVPDDLMP